MTKDLPLEPCCGETEEGYEKQGGFVVAGGDTAHLLEPVKYPLDAVPVTLSVCFLRRTSAFAYRNNRQDPVDQQILAKAVAVIAPVGQHYPRVWKRKFPSGRLWVCSPRPACR